MRSSATSFEHVCSLGSMLSQPASRFEIAVGWFAKAIPQPSGGGFSWFRDGVVRDQAVDKSL